MLEQITKINQHSDFVKGVTWDPAGKFLASQVHDGFLFSNHCLFYNTNYEYIV